MLPPALRPFVLRGATHGWNCLRHDSQLISSSLRPFSPAITACRTAAGGPLTATQTVPASHGSQVHHDYVNHWKMDRLVSIALLPLVPWAFLTDSVLANYLLILTMGAHTHWGMESVVVDYMRPRVVGKAGYYISLAAIYALSFATFAGLLYLNYSQLPPTKAIKKLWSV